MQVDKLKTFRQEVYNRLGAARDATFELTDAVLLTRNASCLADLSLSPVFRRLRSNLCLWSAPPPYSGKGRPRLHGDKFKLNDPQTWGEPDESLEVDDPKLGRVRLRLWRGLHFRKAASHPMLLLRVERLEQQRCGRVSKPLWLAWIGEQMPPLTEVWRFYLRRFAVDHWYRFAKQRLHWTLPKLSTPSSANAGVI